MPRIPTLGTPHVGLKRRDTSTVSGRGISAQNHLDSILSQTGACARRSIGLEAMNEQESKPIYPEEGSLCHCETPRPWGGEAISLSRGRNRLGDETH